MSRLMIRLIRGYQRASRWTPSVCRYWPTCSSYAVEAIERYGPWRGGGGGPPGGAAGPAGVSLLADLLLLRGRGHRTLRPVARRLDGPAAHRALSPFPRG